MKEENITTNERPVVINERPVVINERPVGTDVLTKRWKDMGIKDKCAIGTAIAAFIFGWGLTIAGFIVPPLGVVSDGVLFVLGQGLVYSASVFGIVGYFNASSIKMKKDIHNYVDNELNEYERRRREDIG